MFAGVVGGGSGDARKVLFKIDEDNFIFNVLCLHILLNVIVSPEVRETLCVSVEKDCSMSKTKGDRGMKIRRQRDEST